ncbi:60S ribosomal protein L23 [Chionoecetes opilio]|uniref:60S ribosomal protein L23 n=1 Tax=Chionoecetes opilio TaxID=41210 RepID=A0A8J4YND7_CHIOP|nr:60S ribosomal protein L23 [Chionoecetes opilio]
MSKKGREAASGGKSWISLSLPTDVVMSYANNPSAKNMYIIAAVSDIVDATSKKGGAQTQGEGHTLSFQDPRGVPRQEMVTFSGFPVPKVSRAIQRHIIHPPSDQGRHDVCCVDSKELDDICFPHSQASKPDLRNLLED